MNIVEKIKDNRYKKKLLKRIDRAKLEYFCLTTGVKIDYFSNYFLELLSKYPKFLDDLINATSSIELDKLNNNTYTLNDITYDNLWLLKYLEFSDEEKKVIDIINNSINKENVFLDSKYYFVKCNSLEEISNLNIENQNLVESYFEDINLVTDTTKCFKINEFDFNDSNITICNPVDDNKVIVDLDLKLFYEGDLSLNENTIIYIDYDKFLELSKNKEFLSIISNCQVVFKQAIKTETIIANKSINALDYIFKNNLFKSNKFKNIKINHLLYIVNLSDLSEVQKEVYSYKIIKYFNSLEENDTYIKYQNYNEFQKTIQELQEIIGLEKIKYLTDEFNKQDKNTKNKEVPIVEFTANIFIDSIYNFDTISVSSLLKIINDLSPNEALIVLNDERIINKLKELFDDKSTLEDRKTIISREIALSKYPLNHHVVNFIRRLNIDIKKFISLDESVIEEPKYINPLTYRYGITAEVEKTNISIGSVVGYDTWNQDSIYHHRKNVLLSMGDFFGDRNDGYHTRSLGMLDYTSEEIVPKLQNSFEVEPMILDEVDDGKYCISTNGMHRYTILRIHYLLDKLKNKIPDNELDKKYSIPVKVKKKDYFKTYCNYLLSLLDNNIDYVSAHLDNNYNYTGLVKVSFKDGTQKIMNDIELKVLVKESIKNINDNSLYLISYNYDNYQTFKYFIDTNFEELKVLIMRQKGEIANEDYQSRKHHS